MHEDVDYMQTHARAGLGSLVFSILQSYPHERFARADLTIIVIT